MAAVTPAHLKHFRPDVEGLRAIAVAMVLLYHAGISWAKGGFAGVDVFFVISGFLITGLLVKEVERTGKISLLDFYARRAKRLLPASATVICASALLAAITLPVTRWRETGGDLVAAAFYFINWRLAWRSEDYLAEDSVPSLAQHFWSLAVEEQYYFVWPLLMMLAIPAFRRTSEHGRLALWLLLGAVAFPSLMWSTYLTGKEPGPAYFVTTTRIWELAIGAVIALGAPWWSRVPTGLACLVGWIGVALIGLTLLLVSTSTPWPGYWAALPTLGTAAAIIGGYNAGKAGPLFLLGTRPMVWIGGISYSLYLWHWPVIEASKAWLKVDRLPLTLACGVISLSGVLAWLTWRFVENPVRFSIHLNKKPAHALLMGLGLSLTGATAGAALYAAAGNSADPLVGATGDIPAGARVVNNGTLQPTDINQHPARIFPDPAFATSDVPSAYADGCQLTRTATTPKECIYGKIDGKRTIAVVGDSKIVQWMPAIEMVAEKHDLRIVLHGKSGCGFTDRMLSYRGGDYLQCHEWGRSVLKLLLDSPPDILLTSMGSGQRTVNDDEIDGLLAYWEPIAASGTKIVALANNPAPDGSIYECVALHGEDIAPCTSKRSIASASPSLEAATRKIPSSVYIDLNDAICTASECPAVVGNVLVYRQGSHLTKSYVITLAGLLEKELVKWEVLEQPARGFTDEEHARAMESR